MWYKRIGLVIMLIILCSCSPKGTTANVAEIVKQKVVFLHYFSGTLSGGSNNLTTNFNEASREYELMSVPIDHEAYKVSILDSLNYGEPPDIYSYWAGARTQSIVDKLEPVDDLWQEAKLDNLFSKTVIDAACTYNGKKYLVPITQHYTAFFYNKKIFQKYGINPPETWEEFISVCDKLKKKGVTPIALGAKTKWPAQFWFDMLLVRTEPYEFRARLMQGKEKFTDEKVQKVFGMWKELIDHGYFNDNPNDVEWDTGADEMVYRGEAAMTLMGSWIIGQYTDEKHKWQQGVDFDFFQFPVIDKSIPIVAMGPVDGLVIPAKAVNKQGAKKVLEYLANVDSQKAMVKGWGNISPNRNIEKKFYSEMQQRIIDKINDADRWGFAFDLSMRPEAAELGLNMFVEFLEVPGRYEEILKTTQKEMENLK